jgi:hypothetical protein
VNGLLGSSLDSFHSFFKQADTEARLCAHALRNQIDVAPFEYLQVQSAAWEHNLL